MEQLITGIHHVTAFAGDPQRNLDFYTGLLGLRLQKKTVNFEAPDVYHLYYGTQAGAPGSILTFFPYPNIRQGRHGKNMLSTTTFSVPLTSLTYWEQRLKHFGISHKEAQERFASEVVLYFEDPDGLGLELVFNDKDTRAAYAGGPVPAEHGIRGFYNVELWLNAYERTASLLTGLMNHRLVAEKGNRFRFAATDAPGHYVDLLWSPESPRGLGGGGTVHHLAFSTPAVQQQELLRTKLVERGFTPSETRDRQYFSSIYFREPEGVLFEVATAGPGFTVDEEEAQLGETLKLPPQYESQREQLAAGLLPLQLTNNTYS